VLRDRFRLPNPGEVEVMVESAPGVTIERAHVGAQHGDDILLVGPGGPLAEDGFEVVFVAGDRAPVTGGCAVAEPSRASRAWLYALGGGVAVVASAVVFALRRRRAKRNIVEPPAG
jgi:hypothetical protein